MLTLKADIRDQETKPDAIRRSGRIPAVFYGKKAPSTPISISATEFDKIWKEGGESAVVTLETPTGAMESLIHEVDFDPVTGRARHADFYVFEKGHKVEVEIPVELEGVSPAVKDLGGTLVKVLYALAIEAEPQHLPHNIPIDVSTLITFGSQILAKDIALPKGVTLKTNPDEVVVLVSAPHEEKEEESKPIDLAAIELSEEKGKKETTEDAAPEAAA